MNILFKIKNCKVFNILNLSKTQTFSIFKLTKFNLVNSNKNIKFAFF